MTATLEHAVLGERMASVMAMAIARAWRDEFYRDYLVGHPIEALAEEGFEVPSGVSITILQETPEVKYFGLLPDVDGAAVAAVMQRLLPLPVGRELRVVQSTDTHWYVVLPLPPADLPLDSASELELSHVAIENGSVSNHTAAITLVTVGATADVAVAAVAVIVLS